METEVLQAVLITGLLGLAGIAILIGLRRISCYRSYSSCSRCGYRVFPSDPRCCSECGADLTRGGAMRFMGSSRRVIIALKVAAWVGAGLLPAAAALALQSATLPGQSRALCYVFERPPMLEGVTRYEIVRPSAATAGHLPDDWAFAREYWSRMDVRLTIVGQDGHRYDLVVEPGNHRYAWRSSLTPGEFEVAHGPLTPAGLRQWLETIGVPAEATAVHDEIGYIAAMLISWTSTDADSSARIQATRRYNGRTIPEGNSMQIWWQTPESHACVPVVTTIAVSELAWCLLLTAWFLGRRHRKAPPDASLNAAPIV